MSSVIRNIMRRERGDLEIICVPIWGKISEWVRIFINYSHEGSDNFERI